MNKALDFLKQLISGAHFTSQQMYECCELLIRAPQAQQAAILALISAKGETVEELTGALRYLFEQATKFHYPEDVIDIVGTGGDRLKTFNISTAAGLVVASCGVKIARYSGRSVTSAAGSIDTLEALHIPIYDNVESICRSLDQYNYAILPAPLFNPVFKSFSPLRKELGIPTMFNILGPLSNPLHPKKQVIGVYRKDLMRKVAQVLQQFGSTHCMIVHGHEGLDELSISAPTYITELKNGIISEYEITPEAVGLKRASLEEILGGDAKENAKIIWDIFSGQKLGALLDIVLLNAAAGLVVAERASSLQEGIALAREAIQSGKTLKLLQTITNTEKL